MLWDIRAQIERSNSLPSLLYSGSTPPDENISPHLPSMQSAMEMHKPNKFKLSPIFTITLALKMYIYGLVKPISKSKFHITRTKHCMYSFVRYLFEINSKLTSKEENTAAHGKLKQKSDWHEIEI